MRLLLLVISLFCAGAAPAAATVPCPAGGESWSSRCFDVAGDARRVKPRYLKRLTWNRHGIALVSSSDTFELLAVNRQGEVMVPNIRRTGDFDYPDAEGGVGRFATPDHGKCGYFQAPRFSIVVPARYDHCTAFRDGEAMACTGCTRYCEDEDCHVDHLVGGEAVELALDGSVRRRYALPTLDTVCGTPERRIVTPGASGARLRCAGQRNPFDGLP
jgi:hypothetical protein